MNEHVNSEDIGRKPFREIITDSFRELKETLASGKLSQIHSGN